MTATYRRNEKFKKDLPVYWMALTKWMWCGKKKKRPSLTTIRRAIIFNSIRLVVVEWQERENIISRFFITPPDILIKEVLSWS